MAEKKLPSTGSPVTSLSSVPQASKKPPAPKKQDWRDLLQGTFKSVINTGADIISDIPGVNVKGPWLNPPSKTAEVAPLSQPRQAVPPTVVFDQPKQDELLKQPQILDNPYSNYIDTYDKMLSQPRPTADFGMLKATVASPKDVSHPGHKLGNPIPRGHTRLYRGFDAQYHITNQKDYNKFMNPKTSEKEKLDIYLKYVDPNEPEGRWFAEHAAAADDFARGTDIPDVQKPGGVAPRSEYERVIYIDVPNSELSKWEVPTTIGGGSKTHRNYSFAEEHPEFSGLYKSIPRKGRTPEEDIALQRERRIIQEETAKLEGSKKVTEYPQYLLPKDLIKKSKIGYNATLEDIKNWEDLAKNISNKPKEVTGMLPDTGAPSPEMQAAMAQYWKQYGKTPSKPKQNKDIDELRKLELEWANIYNQSKEFGGDGTLDRYQLEELKTIENDINKLRKKLGLSDTSNR